MRIPKVPPVLVEKRIVREGNPVLDGPAEGINTGSRIPDGVPGAILVHVVVDGVVRFDAGGVDRKFVAGPLVVKGKREVNHQRDTVRLGLIISAREQAHDAVGCGSKERTKTYRLWASYATRASVRNSGGAPSVGRASRNWSMTGAVARRRRHLDRRAQEAPPPWWPEPKSGSQPPAESSLTPPGPTSRRPSRDITDCHPEKGYGLRRANRVKGCPPGSGKRPGPGLGPRPGVGAAAPGETADGGLPYPRIIRLEQFGEPLRPLSGVNQRPHQGAAYLLLGFTTERGAEGRQRRLVFDFREGPRRLEAELLSRSCSASISPLGQS